MRKFKLPGYRIPVQLPNYWALYADRGYLLMQNDLPRLVDAMPLRSGSVTHFQLSDNSLLEVSYRHNRCKIAPLIHGDALTGISDPDDWQPAHAAAMKAVSLEKTAVAYFQTPALGVKYIT